MRKRLDSWDVSSCRCCRSDQDPYHRKTASSTAFRELFRKRMFMKRMMNKLDAAPSFGKAVCRFAFRFLPSLFCFLSSVFCSVAYADRIKDMASIQGVRDNQLTGYGLVVGLDGTGDQTTQTPFTVQSFISMLSQLCVNLPQC